MNNKNNIIYINGISHQVKCDPTTSLSTFIKDVTGLTGTKTMCHEGGCGACVVTVNSIHPFSGKQDTRSINSCLCPVQSVVGCNIITVEGVGNQEKGFHPIQECITKENGSQCGYCTPGIINTLYSVTSSNPKLDNYQLERSLDGHLCRCTGYGAIINGIKNVECLYAKNGLPDIEDLHSMLTTQNSQLSSVKYDDLLWMTPSSVQEVLDIFSQNSGKSVKLVFGNTSSGFYKSKLKGDILVDIKQVKELYVKKVSKTTIEIGANFSIQDLINEFTAFSDNGYIGFEYLHRALIPLLNKVGSLAVRNVASWAGNLVLRHKSSSFVSDIFTSLLALDAVITIASMDDTKTYSLEEFLKIDLNKKIIVSMTLPALNESVERYQVFKIMPRAANALAIINTSMYVKLNNGVVDKVKIVYGGLQSLVRADSTEKAIEGKSVTKETITECLKAFTEECISHGYSEQDYKLNAARNLLFLFLQYACDSSVSCDAFYNMTSDKFTCTKRNYVYEKKVNNYPQCQPIPKIDALLQSSGEVQYVNDKPKLSGELQAVCVLSTQANATIADIDTSKAMANPGVVKIIQAADIIGENNFYDCADGEPIPILSTGSITAAGQVIALVVAETYDSAKDAADLVVVTYKDVKKPILNIVEALAVDGVKSFEKPDHCYTRGDSETKLKESFQVISGEVKLDHQYHFYLETQTCIVEPYDDMMNVWITSQAPTLAQTKVAKATGKPAASIQVNILRLGGGFGGKIVFTSQLACLTAIASQLTKRPVRMNWNLEDCLKITGKRVAFLARYKAGITEDGHIDAIHVDYLQDIGSYIDGHGYFILHEVLKNTENVYYIPHWSLNGFFVKTNKHFQDTARGPTMIPAVHMMESILEHVAFSLKKDPVLLKEQHLIRNGNPNFRGGSYTHETISKLWPEFTASINIKQWQKDIQSFNKANRFVKKGLAVVPSKSRMFYGPFFSYSSYVTIYASDGTIALAHGGVEMGQGLTVKAIQIAAKTLGIDTDYIKSYPTTTLTGANSGLSAGSMTSECVCKSIKECCEILNKRLMPIKALYPEASWKEVIAKAHGCGIDLAATAKYMDARDCPYHTFGICALEVEVNMLTGMYKLNKMDALYDVGESLNPLIDIGQIEGAICMSLGYFGTEELKYDPNTGVLVTNGTWDYKPPTSFDVPREMNIHLWKDGYNHIGMLPTKAIGEPGVSCGPALLFAIRQAVQSFREDHGVHEYFVIEQPATPDEVLRHCNFTLDTLLNAVN